MYVYSYYIYSHELTSVWVGQVECVDWLLAPTAIIHTLTGAHAHTPSYTFRKNGDFKNFSELVPQSLSPYRVFSLHFNAVFYETNSSMYEYCMALRIFLDSRREKERKYKVHTYETVRKSKML